MQFRAMPVQRSAAEVWMHKVWMLPRSTIGCQSIDCWSLNANPAACSYFGIQTLAFKLWQLTDASLAAVGTEVSFFSLPLRCQTHRFIHSLKNLSWKVYLRSREKGKKNPKFNLISMKSSLYQIWKES